MRASGHNLLNETLKQKEKKLHTMRTNEGKDKPLKQRWEGNTAEASDVGVEVCSPTPEPVQTYAVEMCKTQVTV